MPETNNTSAGASAGFPDDHTEPRAAPQGSLFEDVRTDPARGERDRAPDTRPDPLVLDETACAASTRSTMGVLLQSRVFRPCLIPGVLVLFLALAAAWSLVMGSGADRADDARHQAARDAQTDQAAQEHDPQRLAPAAVPAGPCAEATPAEERPAASGSAGNAVALAPITDFAPGTVYSGTLGEVTRLQAGVEVARAALSLKEVQTRMQELEQRLDKTNVQSQGDAAREDAKQTLERLDRVLRLLEARATEVQAPAKARVLAVRGHGTNLEAVLVTDRGRHVVRAGETVPGLGMVEIVSPGRVLVDGQALPWR